VASLNNKSTGTPNPVSSIRANNCREKEKERELQKSSAVTGGVGVWFNTISYEGVSFGILQDPQLGVNEGMTATIIEQSVAQVRTRAFWSHELAIPGLFAKLMRGA
jgi:hypothetical protein